MFAGGLLELRDGIRPTSGNTAPTGSVVRSIPLPSPAFAAFSGAEAPKTAGTWSASDPVAGTPTWFRFRKTTDAGTTNTTDSRMDGDIGTDMTIQSATLVAGQMATVETFVATVPA